MLNVADVPAAQGCPELQMRFVATIVIRELVTLPEQVTEQVVLNGLTLSSTSKKGLGI